VTAAAIRVRGLVKRYGALEAVGGLDLDVGEGEVVALLGPNGAGKTTTVEILEGFRERTAGEVSVLGHDPARNDPAMKTRIGIVLQSGGIDRHLTVRETIEQFGGCYPRPRPVDEVLTLVGLADRAASRVSRLSGGQRRRLDVGVALAGDPELLFLDEPTTGFDPAARRGAWAMLKDLAALGKTILLTTHYMDEAQALADRVVVIARGRVVAEGPPSTLGDRHRGESVIRFRPPPDAGDLPGGLGAVARTGDGWVELRAADPTRALHELTGWALARGLELEGLDVRRPSLEDAYLALTGEVEG
jgi:ABC-2 type transport system ATP-binding protein